MITVFGSINVDLVCRVKAVPRPGETIRGSDYVLIPGGKGANQALAARRAGADVALLGAIGTDSMADIALEELKRDGVDLSATAVSEGTTGLAIITVDESGENTIVVTPGANARAGAGAIDRFVRGAGDTLLLQMEVPFSENARAADHARSVGARTILSIAPFSPIGRDDLGPYDMIVVNEHEAADLANAYGVGSSDPAATVGELSRHLGKTVIATLGPAGAIAADDDALVSVPAIPVDVIDTTGAGDTFAGTLAAMLDEGRDLEAAMRFAAIAGSLACTREGAQPSFPRRAEIEAAHPDT